MSSPPHFAVSVCLAGHIASLTFKIRLSPHHDITLQNFIDEINKKHAISCSCSDYSLCVSQLYLTSRTSDLRSHQALKSFCPDDRYDKKIPDDATLEQQLRQADDLIFIVGAKSSSLTPTGPATTSIPSSSSRSLKRLLEDNTGNLTPSQRDISGLRVVSWGGVKFVCNNSEKRTISSKLPTTFTKIAFEQGTFVFDRTSTLLRIRELRHSFPAKFSYHHHDLKARNFWASMVVAFYDIAYESRYAESFGKMQVNSVQNDEHSRHLVIELPLASLHATGRSDFERRFDRAVRARLTTFVAKYRHILFPDLEHTPVLSDLFVDNDLETSFDNIMVLAEASGRPILFVTTDYDMTGNDAWYNRICVQQSVTPYQVAQMMSLQFFSRVSMWFDRGVIDMILCVGEYGSFARAITDTFALYDLSFDPDFNTTCAVTKQEALCMFRMAYKDPKSNMIDENHDRFKELVEMAGEYRNSPDPQYMGELLLRQDFFYHFFGVALKHCDANFPLKHLRPPENIWKHSTMTREAVGTVARLSSDQIRQGILDILLYPNTDQGVECDVVRDGLEYSHVPILPLNASGLQSSLKPRDTALPKLLFALGILTMDLKDPRHLKIPNNIMMEEIRALLDLKAGDSVQEFSGVMWIKAHVEKYFRGLDVRYAKDTKEHTLQAIMIVLINQGADINGREVIEELHMMEKPRPPKNRTTHRYADLFLPRTHDVLELKNASIIDLYRGTYGLKLNPDDNDLREFRKQIGRMNISREKLPTPTPESASFYDKQDTGIRQPYKYKQLNDKLTWHDLRVAFRYRLSKNGEYKEGIKPLDQLWRDGRHQALLYQDIIARGGHISCVADPGYVADRRVSGRDLGKDYRFVKAYVVILIAAEVVFVDALDPKLCKWAYIVCPNNFK